MSERATAAMPVSETVLSLSRKLILVLTLAATVFGATVVFPAPASAYTSSVPLTIVTSGCSSALTWKGSLHFSYTNGLYPIYKAPQTTGTVKYCSTKLRASDSNKSADYYVLDTVATWTNSTTSSFHKDAPWKETVASNTASRLNEYSATAGYKKPLTSVRFNVGFSIAGFSLSAPQTLRSQTEVKRASLTSKTASWTNTHADKIGQTELIYAQAVANGVVPKYTVTYQRPTFTYSWRQVTQRYRDGSWLGWAPTQTSSSTTLTHTR